MKKERKQKQIVFSEEVDSVIEGFALGATCVIAAIIVWKVNVFHNQLVDKIVGAVLILFGIAGTLSEFDKISKDTIKGLSDLMLGVVLGGLSFLVIWKIDNLLFNIIAFLFLVLSLFGFIGGTIKIFYSLYLQRRKHKRKSIQIASIVTLATELVALAVVILQLFAEL